MRNMRHLKQSIVLASGSGVRVAVLDSGLDPAFPLVASTMGKSFVLEDSEDGLRVSEVDPRTKTDDSGHGSCVQSCVAMAAPEAIIDHYRILDRWNQCPSRLLCLALDHVVAKKYAIVNLSLGTRNESAIPWLVSIVKRAYEAGTCLVAASSNVGNSLFPGRFTFSISVAAAEGTGPLSVRFQPQSVVEFLGWGIAVPIPVAGGRTLHVSGTSYASGMVTGVCARIVETLGHSNPMDVKLTLRNLALEGSAQAADPVA